MIGAFFVFGEKYLFLFSLLIGLLCFLMLSGTAQKRILIFALFNLPLAYAIAVAGRLLYLDPRPFVVGHFVLLISHATDNGFPSDHTLLCAFIAAIFSTTDKLASLSLWMVASAVAVSRVYVGLHHLTDVVGSVAISIIVAWGVNRYIMSKLWTWTKIG